VPNHCVVLEVAAVRTIVDALERDDLFTVGVFVLQLVGVVRWSLFVRCRAVPIARDDA